MVSAHDAKALVREIRTRELAGPNVIDGIRQARTVPEPSAPAATFPTLREALPTWMERQEQVPSDGGLLGDLPVTS